MLLCGRHTSEDYMEGRFAEIVLKNPSKLQIDDRLQEDVPVGRCFALTSLAKLVAARTSFSDLEHRHQDRGFLNRIRTK